MTDTKPILARDQYMTSNFEIVLAKSKIALPIGARGHATLLGYWHRNYSDKFSKCFRGGLKAIKARG